MWEENTLGGYTSDDDEKRNPFEGETIFSVFNKVRDAIPDVPKPILDLNQSVLDLWNRTPYGQVEEFVPQKVSELAAKAGLPEPVGQGLSLAATIAIPGPGEGMQANKALQGLKRARKASKVVDDIDIFRQPPNATLQPAFATAGVPNTIFSKGVNLSDDANLSKNFFEIKGSPRDQNLTRSTDPFSERLIESNRKNPGSLANQVFEELGEARRASTHHIFDAYTTGSAYKNHPQGERIRRRLFAKGKETGDSIYNYVTAYDSLVNRARIAKRDNLMKLFGVDKRAADDLLKIPGDITRKTQLTKADIGEHARILEEVDVSIAPPVRPKEFPPIRNKKGDVIFQATSQKEWDQRFRIVAEKLGLEDSHLITGQVNTMISKINADPSLNIFSQDHFTYFHDNYKRLPSVKKLNAAMVDGSYAKLSVDDAEQMLTEALTDQRAIVVNYSRMKTRALLQKFPQLRTMSAEEITAFQKANPHEFALGIRGQGFDPSYEKLSRRETAMLNDDLGKLTTQIFGITDRPAPKSQMRFTAK
tara:strand:+ start:49 stop:1647 length:1599 start_codon:yes stop_codon:yes gene_type:complete